ncbi:hypothetical protein QE152_g28994 [Popillia japonica]|uniref:Uncharacterized protein n=1 Tax=Popillia japonica TaxID=7064 RepID=A0AAW1JJQ9_POPJA
MEGCEFRDIRINLWSEGYAMLIPLLGKMEGCEFRDIRINLWSEGYAIGLGTIKPETIQNCFKKAGFRNNEVDVALEEEEPTILQGFTGYASFEDNVATYEIRSIENLIEDVNNTQKEALSDDEDKEESTPMLLNGQALSAVNDLRRYVSSLDNSEDALLKLNYIESFVITNASNLFGLFEKAAFSQSMVQEMICPAVGKWSKARLRGANGANRGLVGMGSISGVGTQGREIGGWQDRGAGRGLVGKGP